VQYGRGLPADGKPIEPYDVSTAMNDLFDRHGKMPMTADVGDCLFAAMEIENTALAAPAYYAGMGFGVPGGIGVPAATGRRPLVLVGDGAFQMNGWEPATCKRHGPDPVVVLFNNASWEMLRVFPAGIALQRPRRLELCGHRASLAVRRAGADASGIKGRAGARSDAARTIRAHRGHSGARCHLEDARALRLGSQGGQIARSMIEDCRRFRIGQGRDRDQIGVDVGKLPIREYHGRVGRHGIDRTPHLPGEHFVRQRIRGEMGAGHAAAVSRSAN
jgi:hypothetical protein